MAIFQLFSKRQKLLRGEVTDVFQYNDLPNHFRVQVIHICRDSTGEDDGYNHVAQVYKYIHDTLCREYGLFTLRDTRESYFGKVANYFLEVSDPENALDVIEITFKLINTHIAL